MTISSQQDATIIINTKDKDDCDSSTKYLSLLSAVENGEADVANNKKNVNDNNEKEQHEEEKLERQQQEKGEFKRKIVLIFPPVCNDNNKTSPQSLSSSSSSSPPVLVWVSLTMGLIIGIMVYFSIIGLQFMTMVIKNSVIRVKGSMDDPVDIIVLTILIGSWGLLTLIMITAVKQSFDDILNKIKRNMNDITPMTKKDRTNYFIGMCTGNIVSAFIVAMMIFFVNTATTFPSNETNGNADELLMVFNYEEAMILPTLLFAISLSFVLSTFHGYKKDQSYRYQQQQNQQIYEDRDEVQPQKFTITVVKKATSS